MSNIYLAAPAAAREPVRSVAEYLTELGHIVTSSWLFDERTSINTAPTESDERVRFLVERDLDDIARAKLVVLFSSDWCARLGFLPQQTTSGGRHIETGYALALGKQVIVVGQPENIFHRGACTIVPDTDHLLQGLQRVPIPSQRGGSERVRQTP
jgi:nucleoside 2-deoxyribosyltransferase